MDESFGAALPRPSEVLAEPNVVVRAPHELLHRVHPRRFAGNDFNPCRGPDTRFAPIQDEEGRCVPSLYAGGTVEAAIYDQHDVDGLIWTSRQCDPDAAVLLFGDRMAAGDIQVVSVRARTDGSFVEDVRQAGKRSGIVITL